METDDRSEKKAPKQAGPSADYKKGNPRMAKGTQCHLLIQR
jgi:hypothetical protein